MPAYIPLVRLVTADLDAVGGLAAVRAKAERGSTHHTSRAGRIRTGDLRDPNAARLSILHDDYWWQPYQPGHDESDPMGAMLDMELAVVVYRLLVKRTVNGGRLFELTASGNIRARLVSQIAPNEDRLIGAG